MGRSSQFDSGFGRPWGDMAAVAAATPPFLPIVATPVLLVQAMTKMIRHGWRVTSHPATKCEVHHDGVDHTATADAMAWPLLWTIWLIRIPQPTGIAVPVICAVAVIVALQRVHRAVRCDHRYRFTTWRWGRALATLLVIGWVLKLASSM